MSQGPRLTDQAHETWRPHLSPGSWALDATAGNGHDTAFLAGLVSPGGHVFAVDCQEAALRSTARRLERDNRLAAVTLIRGDHAHLRDLLPCGARGRLDLICFNLGYLPDGERALTTHPETTLPALHEALLLLSPNGALSVIAYRGHPGGLEEARAVGSFFAALPAPWQCRRHEATGGPDNPGPEWWLATGPEAPGGA